MRRCWRQFIGLHRNLETKLIMKITLYLTLVFIAFELLKLMMSETYWNESMKFKKFSGLRLLEITYFIFIIYLFFVSYWYVGLIVLIVSVITAYQLMDYVVEKSEFNKDIKKYLFGDGMVSILALLIVVFKELLK